MNYYARAVLTSLTACQKEEIRETDKAYVVFGVSIFNAGYTIQLEFSDDCPTMPEDDCYSFYLETQDAIWCLDQIEKQ